MDAAQSNLSSIGENGGTQTATSGGAPAAAGDAAQPNAAQPGTGAASSAQPQPPAGRIPEFLYVLDTTAVPLTGHDEQDKAKGRGPRTHEILIGGTVRTFTFKPNEGLELPYVIAMKFLKTEAFRCVDKEGNPIAYHRQPKQPEELGAGEKFVLADHQTVADYHELTNMALFQRCVEMPGGERFASGQKPDREGMIAFIIKTTLDRRKANTAKEPDLTAENFIPREESDASAIAA